MSFVTTLLLRVESWNRACTWVHARRHERIRETYAVEHTCILERPSKVLLRSPARSWRPFTVPRPAPPSSCFGSEPFSAYKMIGSIGQRSRQMALLPLVNTAHCGLQSPVAYMLHVCSMLVCMAIGLLYRLHT
jgi:hypothetical protein